MAGNHRRQLARTCKRFGLLVQPSALQPLIRELEARGGAESEEFLALLGAVRDRLARAPSPKLVSPSLVEQVLEDERGAPARQQQQKQQQKQLQKQLQKQQRQHNSKKQRTKVVLRDEDEGETGESHRRSQRRHEFNEDEHSSFSSSSSSSSSSLNRQSHHRRSMPAPTPTPTPTPTPVPAKPWRIVSAFDTPKLVYDSTRRQFRYDPPSEASSSLMGTARDLVETRLQRYELVKQKVDRHREKRNLSGVTTIDRLLGTATAATATAATTNNKGGKLHGGRTQQRTLLGMLRSNPSLGCLELEDPTGSLPLAIRADRSASFAAGGNASGSASGTRVDPRGLYLEGSMVLVTGTHEESSSLHSDSNSNSHPDSNSKSSLGGTVFRCASIELPPPEPKAETVLHLPPHPHAHETAHGTADASAGHRSAPTPTPTPLYALSNLALDEPECLERVSTLIDRMIYETSGDDENDDDDGDGGVAAILVLFGNFCTESLTVSGALDELAALLRRKSVPSRHSVLLVPGPADVGSNACWPLPAWNKRNTPSSLHPFLAAPEGGSGGGNGNGGGIVHLCSNPCRLEFSDGRTVLLLRKDLVRESLEHQVLEADDFACPDGSSSSPSSSSLSLSLAHRVVHHATSQSHLSPASSSAPIYWNFDHAMALLPLPELILAGLDAEYLEEGVDVDVNLNANANANAGWNGGNRAAAEAAGCRFVAPVSNPSRNEWQCALAVLGTTGTGRSRIHVEFDNDEDYCENENQQEREQQREQQREREPVNDDAMDEEEEATQPGNDSQDIYEKYRALGGTQTDTQFSQTQTQTQLSAY